MSDLYDHGPPLKRPGEKEWDELTPHEIADIELDVFLAREGVTDEVTEQGGKTMDEDKAEAIHAMTGIDPQNDEPTGGGDKRQPKGPAPTPTAQTFAAQVDRRRPDPVAVTPAPVVKGAERAPTPRGFSPGNRSIGAPVVSLDSETKAAIRDQVGSGSEAKAARPRTIDELRGASRAGFAATASKAAAIGSQTGRTRSPSRDFGR